MPTFHSTIDIAAPPAAVWRVLTDFATYPEWNPMMRAIHGPVEVGARWWLRVALPRQLRLPARAFVVAPERELRWGGGVPGLLWIEHHVALAPEGVGTRVVHAETFDGPLGGLAVRALGVTEAPYRAMNEALKARVEGGSRG